MCGQPSRDKSEAWISYVETCSYLALWQHVPTYLFGNLLQPSDVEICSYLYVETCPYLYVETCSYLAVLKPVPT